MAINYPTSLDDFTNPQSTDGLDNPSHSTQHTNINDAVEALEAKVGVDSSAVTSSHDYKLANDVALLAGKSGGQTLIGGTDASDNFTLQSTSNATKGDIILNPDGGNVGIGTTNPSQKLDVVGKIALNDGGNSVFIGEDAGLNDDGSDNRNVGIGYQALFSNTTGYQNTANGHSSLLSNTTGYQNTANGHASLVSNTTGDYNTANGHSSLFSNTTGGNNTANGHYSIFFNTTGGNNTANGYASLFSNTTGGNNTANGYQAGGYIADGFTPNETGSNSLFLGYDTRANADGETNQIVIGSGAIGIGSNSVVLGNDSITKTILKGNVGIGTSNPTAYIHLKAGTATAGTAPIKLTAGVNNTTPEAGAIEFDGTDLFITI